MTHGAFYLAQALILGAILLLCSLAPAQAQGRKYGLFIGINTYPYLSSKKQLAGCENDARNLRQALLDLYGFSATTTTLLLNTDAKRERILSEMGKYRDLARRGDLFVMSYAGHGSLFPDDKTPDQDETQIIDATLAGFGEAGRYDSTLAPADVNAPNSKAFRAWGNMILDDELYDIFAAMTAKGVTVVFVSDSCHSGSIARGLARPRGLSGREVLEGLGYANVRGIPAPARSRSVSQRNFNGLFLALTGARDQELSLDYDNPENGQPTGLMSYVLVKALRLRKTLGCPFTYQDFLDTVAPEVARRSQAKENDQHPQIDSRYFTGPLGVPAFELPGPFSSIDETGPPIRVGGKALDENGQPVEKVSVGFFPVGMPVSAGNVTNGPNVGLWRTDAKGFFDSAPPRAALGPTSYLRPGCYQVKALRAGYEPFYQVVKIPVLSNGQPFLLTFRLERAK